MSYDKNVYITQHGLLQYRNMTGHSYFVTFGSRLQHWEGRSLILSEVYRGLNWLLQLAYGLVLQTWQGQVPFTFFIVFFVNNHIIRCSIIRDTGSVITQNRKYGNGM
jgi:hypothetical protein